MIKMKLKYFLLLITVLVLCSCSNFNERYLDISQLISSKLFSSSQTYKTPYVKPASGEYHIVKKGETLYSIAKANQTDVKNLSALNNIYPPFSINVGQKIKIRDTQETASQNYKKNIYYKNTAEKLPKPPSLNGKYFLMPVKGKIITYFGDKGKGKRDDGINIKAAIGTPIKASQNGVVAYTGEEIKASGKLVLIQHANGWISAYAHCNDIKIYRGQIVKKGDVIATVGDSGKVSTPQLHFELRKNKKAVDPLKYIK